MSKTLKVMTSAALLAGVVAPVAVDTVSANSNNVVEKVVSLDDNYTSYTYDANGNINGAVPATSIFISEDDVDFTSQDTFMLSLPTGVEWLKNATHTYDRGSVIKYDGNVVSSVSSLTANEYGFEVVSITSQDLELKLVDNGGAAVGGAAPLDRGFDDNSTSPAAKVKVPLYFEVDGADNGEVKLTVDGQNSTISTGVYTIATISDGNTNTTIAKVETIGDGNGIATIRIDETSIGAISSNLAAQTIKLKLPSKFNWQRGSNFDVIFGGGFVEGTNVTHTAPSFGDNELEFTIDFSSTPSSKGTIWIEGLEINADNNAPFGEVEMDIDGTEITGQTLVVAKYAEYGTVGSLKGDIPTLIAGRNNEDTDDLETVEFELKEAVAGSWLPGRSVEVEVPAWAKIVGIDLVSAENIENASGTDLVSGATGLAVTALSDIDGESNVLSFDLPNDLSMDTAKKSIKAKLYVSSKANAEGDLTVKVSGRAGVELPETPLAKVISPVQIEVEKADVRTGIKAQPIENIVITENVDGAFIEDGTVEIWLPDDVEFTAAPQVEVTEGNLEIDEESIAVSDNYLRFDIDSESTRASKIEISGLKLDLNRSVAEGDIVVKVGGSALVKNHKNSTSSVSGTTAGDAFGSAQYSIGDKTYDVAGSVGAGETVIPDSTIGVGEFDQAWTVKGIIATVVTPADGNATVNEVKFTIGSTAYTVDGQTVEMDVAAFVEAGRTFLPVRYVANALGVSDANILYDNATGTVTILKGDRIAQTKLGSNVLTVNGANVPMDVTVKTVDGRTVLPLRYVAQALGADVQWDEATQTVTIK